MRDVASPSLHDLNHSVRVETAVASKVDPKLHRCNEARRSTTEFAEDWEKRFAERINVDDFLDLYARVYEKYFTDAEICELIVLQRKTPKTAKPSPSLAEKLKSVMPLVKRDFLNGCSQIGGNSGPILAARLNMSTRVHQA